VTEAVPLERMAALSLAAFEAALRAQARNGSQPTAEVRYTIGRLAMAAPDAAARWPRVLAALPPEVRAAVIAQVGTAPATPAGPPGPDTADSERVVGTTAAARLLGRSGQAVRAAVKRGTLPGTKRPRDGVWVFARADLESYRESHAKGH
jgi:hypothetical protein